MSNLAAILLGIFGLLAGASLVIQASLNAGLRTQIQSVSWAGFISYVGGTLVMALALVIERVPLRLERATSVPFMWWLGGLFGAAYLGASIVLVPRVGAATTIALVVAGQLLCSLALDHYGLLGVPRHALTSERGLGALLLFAGVLLIRR